MDQQPLDIQHVQVKVKVLEANAPGFLPRYRQLLSAKRVSQDFEHAQPEDIDQLYALLEEHIVEPTTHAEKKKVLDMVSADELGSLFNIIMGANLVPPANGAA